jgi:hypothetical protein
VGGVIKRRGNKENPGGGSGSVFSYRFPSPVCIFNFYFGFFQPVKAVHADSIGYKTIAEPLWVLIQDFIRKGNKDSIRHDFAPVQKTYSFYATIYSFTMCCIVKQTMLATETRRHGNMLPKSGDYMVFRESTEMALITDIVLRANSKEYMCL